jgi:hypothetical protein
LDSAQLEKIMNGLSKWFNFDKQILNYAPKQNGAYFIRLAGARKIGRLHGESDILYIGSNNSKGGLKQRFSQYLHPGPTQWTNRRMQDLAKKYSMEVAWFVCDNPVNVENSLLKQYVNDHDELPPMNHADVRRLFESPAESIGFANKVTVKLIKGKQEDPSS